MKLHCLFPQSDLLNLKFIKIVCYTSILIVLLSVSIGFAEWISFLDGSVTRSSEAVSSMSCTNVSVDQTGLNDQCKVDLTFPGAILEYPDDNGLLAGQYAVLGLKNQNMRLMSYHINGTLRPDMQGMPNLPFARFLVRIPASVSKVSVEVVNTNYKEVNGEFVIGPVQEDLPESFYYGIDYDWRKFQINNQVYGNNAFYNHPVEQEIGICHGMKILEVHFSPVQVNAVTKKLLVTDKAQLIIKYLDGNISNEATPNLFGRVINKIAYDGIAGGVEPKRIAPIRGGKVVTVSKPTFLNSSTYSDWKAYREAQGYEFIEEIDATGMSASQIESSLQTIYDGSNKMDFVIIIGDETVIPIPTDDEYYHYKDYSRLEGDDNLEDIALGIFLCDDEDKFANIVQKQKWHEEGGPWSKTILMAAGMEDSGTKWDRFSSGHYSTRYLDKPNGGLGYKVNRVYKVPRIPVNYGGSYMSIPTNDFEEWTLDPDPFFTSSSDATDKVNEYWNEGMALMGHRDHGSTGGTGSPSIKYGIFASTITSQASPFFTCLNCLTGNFKGNHSSNFAYQAQSRTYGTSVIISATKVTYSGENDRFHVATWELMHPEDGSTGERNIGQIWLAGHVSGQTNSRTYFHIYGDPMTTLTMGDMNPFISLSAPTGGEEVEQDKTYNIRWNDNINGNVKIELLKGGNVISELSASTESDGTFEWEVGNTAIGTDYKVKVTSIDSSALFHQSIDNFSIIGERIFGIPYHQDFNTWSRSTTGFWEQSDDDDLNWTILSGPTPSRDGGYTTGPEGDFPDKSGQYIYIEASGDNYPGKKASIITPKFNFQNVSEAKLRLYYHMYSGEQVMGDFFVDVQVGSGGTWEEAKISLTDNDYGDNWIEKQLDLDFIVSGNYTAEQKKRVKFRLRGITSDDSDEGWSSDICVDSFSIDNVMTSILEGPISLTSFDMRLCGSKLRFNIPVSVSSPVSIKLYNIQGKMIKTLVNGKVKAGQHMLSIDKKIAAGMYFCRMEAKGFTKTINVLLTK